MAGKGQPSSGRVRAAGVGLQAVFLFCCGMVLQSHSHLVLARLTRTPGHAESYSYKIPKGQQFLPWCTLCGRPTRSHLLLAIVRVAAPLFLFTLQTGSLLMSVCNTTCMEAHFARWKSVLIHESPEVSCRIWLGYALCRGRIRLRVMPPLPRRNRHLPELCLHTQQLASGVLSPHLMPDASVGCEPPPPPPSSLFASADA